MDEDDGNANKNDRDGDDAGQTNNNTASIVYDDVDDLLTKELLLLTTKDRNAFQEKIHGVKYLCVDETPELLQHVLSKLADESEHKIAKKDKTAYLEIPKVISTVVTTTTANATGTATGTATGYSSGESNTDWRGISLLEDENQDILNKNNNSINNFCDR